VSTPDARLAAQLAAEAEADRAEYAAEARIADPEPEADMPDAEPEADLGHDYDGPELRSGTPEYEAEYAEYLAWAGQAEPEPEDRPVPYTLTPRAEAVCTSWDAYLEAEPEPEAEL
jgi:hypothetical protein